MASGPAAWRGHATIALLMALAAAAAIAFAQSPAAGMYGYDGPYHIRYSRMLREDLSSGRGFSRQFPQWQETFLKDRWADKDLLYHLLLIPFTYGDLDAGGKTASIVFGAALYLCLFLALRWSRAPAPAVWTLAALLTSTTLLYRAGLVRSHVLAIALALLGAAAIARRSAAWTFLASAAYGYTHIAWHLMPGIALVHDGARALVTRRFRPASTLAALAGTAVAAVANPYFPNDLRLWWVQNVEVLALAWSPGAPDLSLGREITRGDPLLLLRYDPGPVLFTLAGLLALLAVWRAGATRLREAVQPEDRQPEDRLVQAAGLGALTLGFLGLALLSRRFVEFWAPFSALFAAVAAGRWLEGRAPAAPRRRMQAAAALLIAGTGLGAWNLVQTRSIIAGDPGHLFGECAGWIRDNVPPSGAVFTTDWDEFPDLYFAAPRQRYLVGLDPTFMYVTDPGRWRLWRDIVGGRVADIVTPIRDVFGCGWIFADAGFETFIERADQDPMLRGGARDPDCGVYALRDDPAPPLACDAWRLEGGPPREAGPYDFIDVAAFAGAGGPAGGGPAGSGAGSDCATLHGSLTAPAAVRATMAISTDDPARVAVNGRELFDSAKDIPSLDDAAARQRGGERGPYEHRFGADLAAGYNDVAVTTCRAGHAWGFFLRVLPQSGP